MLESHSKIDLFYNFLGNEMPLYVTFELKVHYCQFKDIQSILKMEGKYAQLKSEGFTCSAFFRITRNRGFVYRRLFHLLNLSQLKILFHSFDSYLDDPHNKEQADYADVASAYQRLQKEIEKRIYVESAYFKTTSFEGILIIFLFFYFIDEFMKYLLDFDFNPKERIKILIALAFLIITHGAIIGYICFKRTFPLLFNHRVGCTKLVRLCRWLYKWTWEGMHRWICYYCRLYDLRRQYLDKKRRRLSLNNQEKQQEEMKLRSFRGEKRQIDFDRALQEEMIAWKALKDEEYSMTAVNHIRPQTLFPVDHNSINDSLIDS